MSSQPQLKPPLAAPLAGAVYYIGDRAPIAALRPLTTIEQMFAYWGSDLAA